MKLKIVIWTLLCGLIASFFSCHLANAAQQSPQTSTKIEGKTMGPIRYCVTVNRLPENQTKKTLGKAIQARLDQINELMSTYVPDSDVSLFNQSRLTSKWFDIDSETAIVIQRAQQISYKTQGKFDITVGPAVSLWNVGPGNQVNFQPPTEESIARIKPWIGYQQLNVRLDPPALKKSHSNLQINLSAIAKGYAVDQVASLLDQFKITDYLIEIGGEVVASGQRPQGGDWRVGISIPDGGLRDFDRVVHISGQAIATSGDYHNFSEFAGQRFSHTIDPATCRPVTHNLASVSLIADDCMTADAIATAVLAAGHQEGIALCEELEIPALFIQRNQNANQPLTYTETISGHFPLVRRTANQPPVTNTQVASQIWPTFLAALALFGIAILAMAVGVMFGNKPVQGSCGGLSSMKGEAGDSPCMLCTKPATECEKRKDQQTMS